MFLNDENKNPTATGNQTSTAEKPFANFRPAQYHINTEKAKHRIACQMSTVGYTNIEIANALGMTPCAVSNILRQDWAQEYMRLTCAEAGEEFRQKIIAEGQKAFARIVARAEGATPASESLKHDADKELLNRYLGKAVQPVEQISRPAAEKSDDDLLKDLNNVLNPPRVEFND